MPLLTSTVVLLALQVPSQKAPDPPVPPVPPFDSAWTREAWTADETPYLRVRKEVEAYVLGRRVSQTKTDLVERTSRMLVDARANPKDPVALYRAASYAWMLAGLDYSPEAHALLTKNPLSMGALPSPHSREFDRLRMLREAFLNTAFIDLGERLYKADPDDRELAIKLAWVHSSYGPGSRKRAVEITTRLLKNGDPKRYPAIYYAYAEAHGVSYTTEPVSEHAEHAKRAAWGYRQYIAAGPAWRPKAIDSRSALEWFDKYLRDHGQANPPG